MDANKRFAISIVKYQLRVKDGSCVEKTISDGFLKTFAGAPSLFHTKCIVGNRKTFTLLPLFLHTQLIGPDGMDQICGTIKYGV